MSVLRRRLAGCANSIQIHRECSKQVHEANSDQNCGYHECRCDTKSVRRNWHINAMSVSVLRRRVSAGVNPIQIRRDCWKQVDNPNSDQNCRHHAMPRWYKVATLILTGITYPWWGGLRRRLTVHLNSIQISWDSLNEVEETKFRSNVSTPGNAVVIPGR